MLRHGGFTSEFGGSATVCVVVVVVVVAVAATPHGGILVWASHGIQVACLPAQHSIANQSSIRSSIPTLRRRAVVTSRHARSRIPESTSLN